MRLASVLPISLTLAVATACNSSHGSLRPSITSAQPPASRAASASVSGSGTSGLLPRSATATSAAAAATPSPTPAQATETNPAGDIADNTIYVPYAVPGVGVAISIPEGWARQLTGGAITFTDKLNSIVVSTSSAQSTPTVSSATAVTVHQLQQAVPSFTLLGVTMVQRKAGPAVLVHYQADSAANPVTNKVIREDVQRYEFFRGGIELDVTVSGPINADNVDPWNTVTNSVQWK